MSKKKKLNDSEMIEYKQRVVQEIANDIFKRLKKEYETHGAQTGVELYQSVLASMIATELVSALTAAESIPGLNDQQLVETTQQLFKSSKELITDAVSAGFSMAFTIYEPTLKPEYICEVTPISSVDGNETTH